MGSPCWAVFVIPSPTGSQLTIMIAKLILVIAIGGHCVLGARRLTASAAVARDGKSLVNTFPFNANHGDHHAHDHHDHHDHRAPSQSVAARSQRQGSDERPPSFSDVAGASPGNDGRRCIDKVEMVEETEYDDVVQCDHSYDKRCHTTFVTNYESQQEEECEENYRKSCFTEYESECWTKQEVHDVQDDVVSCETIVEEKCEDETSGYTTNTKYSKWPREVCSVDKKNVKKYTPITGCTKEPRELCAPAGCGFKQGAEECYDKVQTVVQDAPKEQCTLEPQRACKHVTKLVPKLTPTEECVDVPKEVCTRSRTNPRKVKQPVVKKWCYVPSEESGLA